MTNWLEVVQLAVSTNLSGNERRASIALYMVDHPEIDTIPTGSITFHFKGRSVIPEWKVVGTPINTET